MIAFELFSATATVNGRRLALHPNEHRLLLALAVHRRGLEAGGIFELVWPQSSVESARNRFHVAVHRLRKRLGAPFLVREGVRFILDPDAVVDLWRLQALRVRPERGLSEEDSALLECFLREAELMNWPDWFEATRRSLIDIARAAQIQDAERALNEGRVDRCIMLTRGMLLRDDCDESAWSLLIRAHLAERNRAEALRQYRLCRRALREELAAEPSFDVSALINVA